MSTSTPTAPTHLPALKPSKTPSPIIISSPTTIPSSTTSNKPVEKLASLTPQLFTEGLSSIIQNDLLGELKEITPIYQQNPDMVFIRWQLHTSDTNTGIISDAQQDTVTILHNLYSSSWEFQEVTLIGWHMMTVDINSNEENTEMLHITYQRITLEEINWETVQSRYIWLLINRGDIHWILKEEG